MNEPRADLAVLVYDLSPTGVVHNAVRIAGAAMDAGLTTEMWVMHDRGAFVSRVPGNVAVITLWRGRTLPFRRLETLLAIRTIAAAIAERKPKVLLSAGNHFHVAAGLAYRQAGRPACTRLLGRASNAPPRIALPGLAGLARAIDAFKYREMHSVIAVSRELANSLTAHLGIPNSRIIIIPNGVDPGAVAQQADAPLDDPWYGDDQPPVIIAAGRLSKQKNFALLVDAFQRVRQQRPARLIILGEGRKAARGALQRQAERLGVGCDVRLHGFEANPMRYFSRSALFVLSSRWEGASNVVLEAMACGCPVVATGCPTGVREQLDDGRIGPVVPVADASALAHAIAARLDAPRNSEGLKRQAARFDQRQMLAEYVRLVRDGTAEGQLDVALGVDSSGHGT